MMVDLTGQSCFRFIEVSAVSLGINGAVSLAIGGAILMGADIAVSFSGFSLW